MVSHILIQITFKQIYLTIDGTLTGTRVDLRVMAMKEYFTLPTAQTSPLNAV